MGRPAVIGFYLLLFVHNLKTAHFFAVFLNRAIVRGYFSHYFTFVLLR